MKNIKITSQHIHYKMYMPAFSCIPHNISTTVKEMVDDKASGLEYINRHFIKEWE